MRPLPTHTRSARQSCESKLSSAVTKVLEPLANFAEVAARLDEVEKQFDSVAQGKPYLTPAMLQHLLTSRFGIFFDDGELHEAMLSLDSSGDGQIQLVEFLEWIDDEAMLALYVGQAEERLAKKNRIGRRKSVQIINSLGYTSSSTNLLGDSPQSGDDAQGYSRRAPGSPLTKGSLARRLIKGGIKVCERVLTLPCVYACVVV